MKLDFPATERNREAIAEVVGPFLRGRVLEVASGSGQHAIYLAGRFPDCRLQPSDPVPEHRASIEAYRSESGLANLEPPLDLDVRQDAWPVETGLTAVLAINLIHISPWDACLGLFRGAARLLQPGGVVYLYGAYRRPDRPFEPSNQAFDEGLRRENPDWGVRELTAVESAAARQGFSAPRVIEMPANNLSVIFQLRG